MEFWVDNFFSFFHHFNHVASLFYALCFPMECQTLIKSLPKFVICCFSIAAFMTCSSGRLQHYLSHLYSSWCSLSILNVWVYVFPQICDIFRIACLVAQSYLTLCDPMDCSPPGSSVHCISRQGYWSGLPCPPPGDLPNPGIKPGSLTLQVDFFTVWATREAHFQHYFFNVFYLIYLLLSFSLSLLLNQFQSEVWITCRMRGGEGLYKMQIIGSYPRPIELVSETETQRNKDKCPRWYLFMHKV